MRGLWIAVLASLVPSSSVAQFRLQDPPATPPKLIKAGRILDVRNGRYILNRGILTDGERIKDQFWKFRFMAPEDVKAIAEDAHRLGMKVAAHAVDKTNIQVAIDSGVDSVEHGFEATNAQLQQMKDRGIFLVATDIPNNGGSPDSKDRLQRAMKIGVKIAMGSDLWFAPPTGTTYGQAALTDLRALRDEGMPNIDAIRCATINGAELLGWSSAVGEIAPGKFADIIGLSADPLEDVTSLEHVDFVMKGAAVIRNEFAKHEVTRSDSPNGRQH